jgi:NAD(P)-dependent dehydrogenase (short-subunit alcohol dehydrogenase family)
MQEFAGKTAVVTGGASGIGRALADRFAAARMNVVLADIEEDALRDAVRELEARQTRVIGVVTNAMRRDSIQALADQAIAEFGNVHVLCNNAGVANAASSGKPVWELPDSDWDWVMGVNFNGVLYGLQAFVPHMLAHGEPGHIVNTASLAGVLPGGGPYGVSKHAVLALTEGLQNDLASRGANVNASVLCPGFVRTHIFDAERNRPEELAAATAGEDEATAMMAAVARGMLEKGKEPAEIADIVFDSITRNHFYILPHPAWDNIIMGRVEQILARQGVATTNMEDLLKRREAGEQF